MSSISWVYWPLVYLHFCRHLCKFHSLKTLYSLFFVSFMHIHGSYPSDPILLPTSPFSTSCLFVVFCDTLSLTGSACVNTDSLLVHGGFISWRHQLPLFQTLHPSSHLNYCIWMTSPFVYHCEGLVLKFIFLTTMATTVLDTTSTFLDGSWRGERQSPQIYLEISREYFSEIVYST